MVLKDFRAETMEATVFTIYNIIIIIIYIDNFIMSVRRQKSVCPHVTKKTEHLVANLSTDLESARFN